MHRNGSRILVMALAVVALVALPSDPAFAGPCSIRIANTAAERAAFWNEALDQFAAERPGLSARQTQFLREAAGLGDDITALRDDEREQAALGRKATHLFERARSLFTNDELGALFTSMGTTQTWLAQVAAVPAYCNCVGTGDCEMQPGGPKGKCLTGCVTWTDSNGQDRIRVCSPDPAQQD